MAGYIEESVKRAADDRSPAIIVMLNTPGGSLDATQRIDSALLKAPLPTIVYVAPSGGRAASAGTFITMSAALAYMAPGTNIGAASPVGSGGEDLTGTMARRSRTTRWPTSARSPRPAAATPTGPCRPSRRRSPRRPSEAVSIGAVDGIAMSLEDVQRKAERPSRRREQAPVTVDIADAPLVDLDMNPFQSILHLLSDPNIAFILHDHRLLRPAVRADPEPELRDRDHRFDRADPRVRRLRQPAAQRGRASCSSGSRSSCSCSRSP